MLDLLVEIWSSPPVLSSIPDDWLLDLLLVVSSWNRYKVWIVPCIAELLQMLGLALLGLFVQLSTLLVLSRFLPAPGFYEGRVPVPSYFFLIDFYTWASLLSQLDLQPLARWRPISSIYLPWLMSVMICWAIARMIASNFDWMRGICFGSNVLSWFLLFGLLGLAFQGLDSSTVAHRLCMILTRDRSHMLLSLTSLRRRHSGRAIIETISCHDVVKCCTFDIIKQLVILLFFE